MTFSDAASLAMASSPALADSAASSITVGRFDSLASLDAAASSWDAVQDRCAHRHVLLDHRWVRAWWKNYGAGKELHGLVIEKAGRPIGIMPALRSRGWEAWPSRDGLVQLAEDQEKLGIPHWRRLVPIRRVTFPLNIPSHNARSHALIADDPATVCGAVLDYWKARARDWDVLVLEGLPAKSGQREHFSAAASARGMRTLPYGRARDMYTADLTGGMDAYCARRGAHFRKRFKGQIRACEKAGALELRQYRKDEIVRGLDIMFEIEQATWKARPGEKTAVDMSLDSTLKQFFTDVGRAFAEKDEAVVHVMSLDGRPVGALFGLSRGTTILSLVVYLRDDMREVINNAPLWDSLLRDAMARGMTELDTHGVSSHARKWATNADSYQRLYVFSPHLRGQALWASKSLATMLARRLAGGRDVTGSNTDGRD
ncbi:GNAT family N-acetyltransferase [Microvirga brassicacearum]|nr:GNAT family N-acetyltransferase [Microvirga brassicacearum]